MMKRIAMLALGFLLPVSTAACMQGDTEEAILADCSQVNLAPAAVDQCLERARVADETNPSPRLDALIADLKAGAAANAAPQLPPPDDDRFANQGPPDDDLDATAPPPDDSDADAPPADEDMSGPDDNGPDADNPDDNTDQLSPREDEPPQDDDNSPPPPPPATDSGPPPRP